MKKIFLTLFLLAFITLISFFFVEKARTPQKINQNPATLPEVKYIHASIDTIVIDSPLPSQMVSRDFSLSGKARGTWYFEASFPVTIVDEKGAVIARSIAKAGSDWMTTDFVPFSANLIIPNTFSGSARLVLKKDNPSGLTDKDASVSLPIIIAH